MVEHKHLSSKILFLYILSYAKSLHSGYALIPQLSSERDTLVTSRPLTTAATGINSHATKPHLY